MDTLPHLTVFSLSLSFLTEAVPVKAEALQFTSFFPACESHVNTAIELPSFQRTAKASLQPVFYMNLTVSGLLQRSSCKTKKSFQFCSRLQVRQNV